MEQMFKVSCHMLHFYQFRLASVELCGPKKVYVYLSGKCMHLMKVAMKFQVSGDSSE